MHGLAAYEVWGWTGRELLASLAIIVAVVAALALFALWENWPAAAPPLRGVLLAWLRRPGVALAAGALLVVVAAAIVAVLLASGSS